MMFQCLAPQILSYYFCQTVPFGHHRFPQTFQVAAYGVDRPMGCFRLMDRNYAPVTEVTLYAGATICSWVW